MSAQPPPDETAPLPYVQPPKNTRLLQLDHVAGQVVMERIPKNWFGTVQGLRIALFDTHQAPVSTVLSGEGGRFEIKDVAPGAYTLVVGAEKLHPLSIPLLVGARPVVHARVEPALLLTMHAQTDRRKSVATLIANQQLRAELLEMVKKDQDIRNEWIRNGVDHPDPDIQTRWKAIDAQNLERMEVIVTQFGWPDPALVGVDGTDAAFLLVQHGSHTFQKAMLPRIRTAYRSGKLSGQDYALLLDRVLVGDGKPQVYGTQAKPVAEWKDREPALNPIEDEAHVDERRAKVGMFPLADYLKMLKEAYYPQEKASPESKKR